MTMIAPRHLFALFLGVMFCVLVICFKERKLRGLNVFFFCVYFYLIFDLTFKTTVWGWNYYILRNSVPFIVLCLTRFVKIGTSFKLAYQSVAVVAVAGFGFLNSNYNAEFTKQVIGLPWDYWVFIEYLVFSILFFEVFAKKMRNDFQAFSYTLLLLPAIGFMYKLPVFALPSLSSWYPFFFASSPIMLLFVCHKIGFSPFTKPTVLFFLFLSILFGVYYYYFNPTSPSWIVRIPTLVFWLVAISHMKATKKNEIYKKLGE